MKNEIKTTDIPIPVLGILQKLKDSGYKAYIVGGCVRDLLLSRPIHDYDITTNATPDQVIEAFKDVKNTKIIPTGLQHGTVTLMWNNEGYEITTFRQDGDYSDGRHPDKVSFVDDIVQDLARRDFTINAMAWNPSEGLIDPFNGLEDLEERIIRCVGNPHDRFTEDALRILRAWRFSCQLNFEIDMSTRAAMYELHDTLNNISQERIHDELCKAIMSDPYVFIYRTMECECLPWIIDEWSELINCKQKNPWHYLNVENHTLLAIRQLPDTADIITRLAVLFHDIGKPRCKTTDENGIDHFYTHPETGAEMTDEIMKRLKFDNNTRTKVVELVRYHDVRFVPRSSTVKRWLNKLGEEQFRRWIDVRRADAKAQVLDLSQDELDKLNEIEKIMEMVIAENQVFQLKDLAINGHDLIAMGFPKDKTIGDTLQFLLQYVISDGCRNTREELMEYALKLKED